MPIGAPIQRSAGPDFWPPPRLPDEDFLGRSFRHAEDRRHLADLDDRLLLDVGLDRGVIERGFPFDEPPASLSSSRRINP